MIYRTSYFKKELRQSYTDNKTSRDRKITFALFSGLVSFAVFFLLQTLKDTVVAETFPEIMQPSYFSTIYIYVHMSFVLNTVYFIINYDYLFFSEIRKNSWYLLVQMGYNPVRMFAEKLLALFFSVMWTYTVGFALVILLTTFLRYNLVFSYIPSLFVAGTVNLVLISLITLMISLYARTVTNARYLIIASAALILVFKRITGFYAVLSNRVIMQNIFNIFDPGRSWFMPLAAAFIILAFPACAFRANETAKYYNPPDDEASLPEGVSLLRFSLKTCKLVPADQGRKPESLIKILNAAVSFLVIILICAMLMFNIMIIIINATAPGNEVVIRGVIPYVFKSETMKPAIMPNDLAFFRMTDRSYDIDTGQIIIFRKDNKVYVERVVEEHEDYLTVDIDHYPSAYQAGSMRQTIQRESVIGIFDGRSRWLGALILFANTVFGRLLFLLVPAVLLFYYRQIFNFYIRKKAKRQRQSGG